MAPPTKNIIGLYYRATPACGGGVGIMTFLDISNLLAVKHKKRIFPQVAPPSGEIF